jgi:type IV pilus assembly protein PilV
MLIALLVLSFGVLGMAALHGRALQYSLDAEDRNRAALLASEIASTMWLNHSTTLPSATLSAWQSKVQNTTVSGLPNAAATVSTADSTGMVTVTVSWRPTTRSTASSRYQYITQVVLP